MRLIPDLARTPPWMIRRVGLAALAVLAILAGSLIVPRAWADATPVRVVLTYQAGRSNWGASQASGVAEIVRAEGDARVSVRGLTAPSGVHLVAWLGRSGSSDSFRLGPLTIGPDGVGTLDVELPDAIPDRGWNAVFITAEDSAAPEHPSNRRSLVGEYPKPNPDGNLPYGMPDTGMADGG